jgi:2-C-methyl-D-erythritol 2,4-cyclodiphosphate synthase
VSNRVGLGFDVHPFGGDGPLVLGGVAIEGPGLAGHSDADVVAHAVADALLGAAALDDLGSMFPASDDRYAGISSIELLRQVAVRVAQEGWSVVNVDVSIAAESPRLAPHLPGMRGVLRQALAAAAPTSEPVPVRVAPKRAEGLGSIGRAEGVAAWAVALLES